MAPRLLTAAVMSVTTVVFPAVAAAAPDDVDEAFVRVLARHGIVFPSMQQAMEAGRDVCRAVHHGWTFDQIVSAAVADGIEAKKAAVLVGAAVPAYCPDVQPALEEYIAGHGGGAPSAAVEKPPGPSWDI